MQNYVGQNYPYSNNVAQQPVTNPQVAAQVPPIVPPNNTVQVPNYSGVNIQIFNPAVCTPGGSPTYNVNAPQYYPAGYYTGQWQNGNNGLNNGGNNGANSNNDNNSNTNNINNTNNTTNTKKEKRDIVLLTDDYIKNLESYLNSQDREIRMSGAKEVVARIKEDESRRDDKALTALINKMLQDPDSQIRLLALSMLHSRKITGDEYTKGVLQNMQNSKAAYGQDALTASDILLKMSGQTVKKEFDVLDKPKESKKQ